MTPFGAQSIIFSTTTGDDQRKLMTEYLVKHIPALKNNLENAPDILWIEDEKALGIEQIRDLKEWFQEKPYSNDWKVAILLRADTLTTEAQNAALKLLEEPPRYAHILLVTAKPFALQATIRSRCTILVAGTSAIQHTSTVLPTTMTEVFAAVEPIVKDRAEAVRFFEELLLDQHKTLYHNPTTHLVRSLKLAQTTLHLLKRNVNVRLAVESFFLQNLSPTH